jgi:hypothetical protein
MRPRFQPKLTIEDEGARDGMGKHPYLKAELATCHWVTEKLERYYPGHAWFATCIMGKDNKYNVVGGVIGIRINALMPANEYYKINMADLLTDSGTAIVMRAAGELLERYNIPRSGFDMDHWRGALNSLPILAQKTGRGDRGPLRD